MSQGEVTTGTMGHAGVHRQSFLGGRAQGDSFPH